MRNQCLPRCLDRSKARNKANLESEKMCIDPIIDKRSVGIAMNTNAKAANLLSSDKTVPTALLPLVTIFPKCQTSQAALDCTLGSPRRPSGYFRDGREGLVTGVDP